MGKMLVTGCLSRQCNPQKNKRDVMPSWLLAEALRDMGHEVEHRNPTINEDYEEFDQVFIGLAAMHSIGCNRSYGAMAALLKAYQKVTLYIDDPDTAKVLSGLRVMKNDPKKFIKPYYTYRLEYAQASQPEWHKWLMTGIDLLHDYAWPKTIVPMFPWGDVEKMRAQLPNATELVQLDLSSYIPEYVGEDEWAPERDQRWLTEGSPDNKWLQQQRNTFAMRYYGKGFDKRPDDHGLVLEYAKNWGVIDPGLPNGFFNSRIVYAAQARALYVTKWQDVQSLGNSYSMLVDTVEGIDQEQRHAWAEAQNTALQSSLWTRDQLKDALSPLLRTEVAA